MTESDLRDLFREMREEPLPADSLSRVRLNVARQTARGRAWWWLFAAAPVTAAAIFMLTVDGPATLSPPAPPTPPILAQETELRVFAPVAPMRHTARRGARPKALSAPSLSIRIETPDPDVVLLFVGD